MVASLHYPYNYNSRYSPCFSPIHPKLSSKVSAAHSEAALAVAVGYNCSVVNRLASAIAHMLKNIEVVAAAVVVDVEAVLEHSSAARMADFAVAFGN